MGRVLQIRISAYTYNPDDVYQTWPRLSKLAWGEKGLATGKSIGVRELATTLEDIAKYGSEWPEDVKKTINDASSRLRALDDALEAALADRRPDKADALSYELEEALGELESSIQ
jgi:hypothetical protein